MLKISSLVIAALALSLVSPASDVNAASRDQSGAGTASSTASPAKARIRSETSRSTLQTVPDVSKATTTLECSNGKAYEVSTGNDKGTCTTENNVGTACNSGGTNTAVATCGKGCGDTSGSGSCKLVKK